MCRVACKSGFQATLLERLETGICRQQADATSAARLAQSHNKSASLGCSNNKLVEVSGHLTAKVRKLSYMSLVGSPFALALVANAAWPSRDLHQNLSGDVMLTVVSTCVELYW